MQTLTTTKIATFWVAGCVALSSFAAHAVTKVGIIGCDTSHAIAFTKVMNVTKPDWAADFRVTAAHKWGSKDIFSSTNRYPKYIAQLEGMGVEMCATVDDLLTKVDVVCLETNDGREHLWQAEKCFKAKKRVFIDKPIAEDYAHAKAIYDLGKKYGAAYFSTSTLRYAESNAAARAAAERSGTNYVSCIFFAPSPIETQGTHSRYVWYGIHGFETVMTVMGRGATSVRAYTAGANDFVTIAWADGRAASLKLDQKSWAYGGYAFPPPGESPVLLCGPKGYEPMLKNAILPFFRTGVEPVPHEETLEMFAIMEAAEKSHAEGGREVSLMEITLGRFDDAHAHSTAGKQCVPLCNAVSCPGYGGNFVWENDKFGMFAYGPTEFHRWSGLDVFNKSNPKASCSSWLNDPKLNNLRVHPNFHDDRGEGMDNYTMGAARGVGGVGMYLDGEWKTYTSWDNSRVIHVGDDYCEFELEYPSFSCLGRMKYHITLKRGENFFRNDVTFERADAEGDWIRVGPGIDLNAVRSHVGSLVATEGCISLYEAAKGEDGSAMSAIFVAPADASAVVPMTDHLGNRILAFTKARFTYWAGASWSKAGSFTTPQQWHDQVRHYRNRCP